MKTPVLLLVLALAAPSFAQTSQFGLLLGGSMRLVSKLDRNDRGEVSDKFRFSNSVKEAYYSLETEPGTNFRIKAGEITGPTAFRYDTGTIDATTKKPVLARSDVNGTVQHIDALVDYKFSEPFGSSSIFAGGGLYRQHANLTDAVIPADQRGSQSEVNYGFSGGVTADFPFSRTYGFVAEATYHWINYHYRPRYVTLAGGFRFSF